MQGNTREALREIDLATAPAFLAAIREMIDWADDRAVVIDCSGITFMDSSAYHALLDAHDYAIQHEHLLVIRSLAEHCARVIRICDKTNTLTIDRSSDSHRVRRRSSLALAASPVPRAERDALGV